MLKGKRIRVFGTLLERADPSLVNSVTGSGFVAKCSNILQDVVIENFDFIHTMS